MKKLIATLMIAGSSITLAACASGELGYVDTAPPYADERTASHGSEVAAPMVKKKAAPARAERVFREVQSK